MSKYASLLFGPEKYYEVGPFRFPIYKDLVPGESRGIENISRSQSKYTFKSIKLAQKIAKDKNITTKEAIDMLANTSDEDQTTFFDYASEIEELQEIAISATSQKVMLVSLFMKYRGEVKLPKSKEWTKVPDWAEEDTENIPGKVLDKIVEFIEWEREGWPTTDAEAGNEE
jgi:hypothetical protein